MSVEPQPSIPNAVPWEREPLKGRECSNCACYFESSNPQDPGQYQGFCRRWPAEFSQTRGQVPRLDPVTKQPVMRNGVPVMNNELITGYLYKPTRRLGTCFDGYRPLGTLPGDSAQQNIVRQALALLVEKEGGALPLAPEAREQLLALLNGQA